MDNYLKEAKDLVGDRPTKSLVAHLIKNGYNKSTIARVLLDRGLSVTEISKAVPMAYSQAHAIAQKMAPGSVRSIVKTQPPRLGQIEKVRKVEPPAKSWGELPPTGRPSKKPIVVKPVRGAANPKVGKLRVAGLPSDIDAGECANCGNALLIRPTPNGYLFVHTKITAEEYLAVAQFCHAVPRSLLQ